MRILHVVTLISGDGAFGGPLKVALNQAEELRRLGHNVTIAGPWRGTGSPPAFMQGTPVQLFPAVQILPFGFSGIFGQGLAAWLRHHIATFDVVHVHAGRDLVSLAAMSAAHRRGVPYVTQTHGMIGPDKRLAARALDAAVVRRQLGRATVNLTLTEAEEQDLQQVQPDCLVRRLPNGVPLAPRPVAERARGFEVLFCARLHARKRPLHFVAMADLVRQDVPEATFALVGPDEGELVGVLAEIERRGLTDVVCYEGALPYEAVLERMRRADVYVLPSVDEPFPMSLLEALSLGLPSIVTDTCGIARELADRCAAQVTDGSPQALADSAIQLLQDPVAARASSKAARAAVDELFSISAVVSQLLEVYTSASTGERQSA